MDSELRRQQILNDQELKRHFWTTEKREVVKRVCTKEILDPKLFVTSKKVRKVQAILQSREICPEYADFNLPKIRTYVHRLRKERMEKLKNKLPVSPMPNDNDDSDDSDEDTELRAVACRLTPTHTKILKKMFQKELVDPGLQVPDLKLFKARWKLEDAGVLGIDNHKIRIWVYKNRDKRQAKRKQGESSDSDEGISTESEDEQLRTLPALRNKKRMRWLEWMVKIMKERFRKELDRQLSVSEEKVARVCSSLRNMGARNLTIAQVRSWVNNNRSYHKLRTVEAERSLED